jgi:colicin import membrane protein
MARKNKVSKVQITAAERAARKRAKKAAKAQAREQRKAAKAEAKAQAEARKAETAKREAERADAAAEARKAKAEALTKAVATAAEALTRQIVSQERDWVIRMVFRKAKRRGAKSVPSVFVTRTSEMASVAEARVSATMRERVTKRTGRTADGSLAPLTFGEAWDAAHGLAAKVGATTVSLASGERYATGTRKRVA